MYAIVEIAGQQFKVEKKQEIFVHRLEGKEGSKVEFSDVLLIDNNGKVNVGTPSIKGATVSGKILEHLKGDKVLVFKKKRRKGYQKLNGHRDQLTKIVIENILEKAPKSASAKASADKAATAKAKADKPAGAKKAAPKSAAKKSAAPKAKADKPAAAKASADKPAAKKPAAKKPAAKKPAAKKPAAPKTEAKPKTAPKAKKAGDDKKETK